MCTFIRHNARAAVGIIGTPGAIAMLKGIANYRCASSGRSPLPMKARIRSSLFSPFMFSFLFFLRPCRIYRPRHHDDRVYPLIRPGGVAFCTPRKRAHDRLLLMLARTTKTSTRYVPRGITESDRVEISYEPEDY